MNRETFDVKGENLFEQRLNQLVNKILRIKLNPSQIKEETAKLEKNWSQNKNYPPNIIPFLNALADHIEADYLYKSFRSFIFHHLKKENRTFSSLTREEIIRLYDTFP